MKRLLLILPLVLMVSLAYSQRAWRSYEWAKYELEFELPEEYSVTINTDDALEAEGAGLKFAVYPYSEKVKYEGDLAGFIVKMSEEDLNLDEIDELELLDVDGFEAGYIAGTKKGLNYLVFGLNDLENGNRFYGYVAFEDEKEQIVEDALEVFQSFGKI